MKKPSLKRHNKGVFYGFFNEPKLNKNLKYFVIIFKSKYTTKDLLGVGGGFLVKRMCGCFGVKYANNKN